MINLIHKTKIKYYTFKLFLTRKITKVLERNHRRIVRNNMEILDLKFKIDKARFKSKGKRGTYKASELIKMSSGAFKQAIIEGLKDEKH